MDQAAGGKVTRDAGFKAQQEAVIAARDRVGTDLERLDEEVRRAVAGRTQQVTYKVVVAGGGIAAAWAVRKALEALWRSATHDDPPADPSDPSSPWSTAALWTVASAVGVALAQLIASRSAHAGWRRLTGEPPPGSAA